MLGNYKIRVNNEAESKEAQELFFELGYKWCDGKRVQYCWMLYLFVDKRGYITMNNNDNDHFLSSKEKELTLPQLRDMVAAYRKTEQGLISGADALRALADGKEVEVYMEIPNKLPKTKGWVDASICSLVAFAFISPSLSFKFRIKPRTITLNIEIPAPFEPKVDDQYWYLDSNDQQGYNTDIRNHEEMFSQFKKTAFGQIGAWRTEEEIKQVVAALRGGIKG